MVTTKGYMIFSIPAIISVFQSLFNNSSIDLVLVIVAVVTSIVGSTMQITHKNLERKVSSKEIIAIYTTGIVIGLIGYMVGDWKRNMLYTMLIGVFGSYMSLDLFKYGKLAVISIIQKLPDFLLDIARQKLNARDEQKNNDRYE